ncbi:hypothetical protein LQZ21_08005 [Treponema sp. TIM-1]|uniref:hypothetical protein n=1 Tax=Treponema sp. TIM-1 TaxID=2898417 RepID=UPI00397F9191
MVIEDEFKAVVFRFMDSHEIPPGVIRHGDAGCFSFWEKNIKNEEKTARSGELGVRKCIVEPTNFITPLSSLLTLFFFSKKMLNSTNILDIKVSQCYLLQEV